MKLIRELSDMIDEELDGACTYAKQALELRETRPELADVMYGISQDEMRHMALLHGEAERVIREYRQTSGEPPAEMMAVYEFLHKKQTEKAGKVKGYQAMYKE